MSEIIYKENFFVGIQDDVVVILEWPHFRTLSVGLLANQGTFRCIEEQYVEWKQDKQIKNSIIHFLSLFRYSWYKIFLNQDKNWSRFKTVW